MNEQISINYEEEELEWEEAKKDYLSVFIKH